VLELDVYVGTAVSGCDERDEKTSEAHDGNYNDLIGEQFR
jgi:hypothetical protein